MNLLTKKELYSNCSDTAILEEFFEDFSYLKALSEKCYKDLNEKDKKRVDEILENVDYISIAIINMINSDYYLKRKTKIIINIIELLNENINERLESHFELLNNYLRCTQEIMYLVETKNNRTIDDITTAYCFSFLSFILIINDLSKDDYEMLNKGNYTDADFKDFKELKRDAKAYELSLVQRNRVYKKTQMDS